MEKYLVVEGKFPPRVPYSVYADFETTLAVARRSESPLRRCREIAEVSRFAPDEFVVELADEALALALSYEGTDKYNQAAVAAWPLRALIERNHEKKALQLLPPILELAQKIEPAKSRAPALFWLWRAFFPLRGHEAILAALVESSKGNLRNNYHLRDAVLLLASENPNEAQSIAESMQEGLPKRQTLRRLAAGEKPHLLPFFGKPLFEF